MDFFSYLNVGKKRAKINLGSRVEGMTLTFSSPLFPMERNPVLVGSLMAFLSLVAALLISGCGAFRSEGGGGGIGAISPDVMREHITYLASDSMMGRNTPSPQLDSAAEYIAREFRKIDLAPCKGSYFQKVPLNIVGLGPENTLALAVKGVERAFELKTDFVPFEMTANASVTAPLLFAGYGITAPEYGYDDYGGLDVRGKVVLLLRHEPLEEDSASRFDGREATPYSNVDTKVRIAREHGAVGVLMVTDPLNHLSLTPRGFPWPSLSKIIPADALPVTLATDETLKVPTVHVGPAFAEALFGSIDSLKAIQRSIDAGKKPSSYMVDAIVTVRTSTTIRDMSAKNVVGVVEGVDPALKNEVVVVGAHYDHVGSKKSHVAGEDYIYNGADDNASGTAGVLAIASAFRASTQPPRRTVLFILFAGEEKGLFGSQAYTTRPLFPLDSTVAMINLDMIGRGGKDTLYVVGTSRSPDMVRINEEENRAVGFTLVYDQERFLARSDQANFLKNGVPSVFLHTGEHADYHKVTDESSRINFDKAARVARLAFLNAWRIANESAHYRLIDKPISLF